MILLHFTILDVHNPPNRKHCILFTSGDQSIKYLYINDEDTQNRFLLFGPHIVKQYFSSKKGSACIECSILDVSGGITQDNGEIVEYRITKEEANKVLNAISKITEGVILFEV